MSPVDAAPGRIAGLEQLAAHVPELRAGRGRRIALLALACFVAATVALLLVDRLWPAGAALAQIVVILVGFGWTALFFQRRDVYRQRWGEFAYRNAFGRHALVGLPVIFAAVAHLAFLPGERVLTGWATPVVSMVGLYLIVTGGTLWVRAALAFGLDNLALLYVYFPQESRLVESSIYGVLRHPVYAAVIRVGLALGLWRGTLFSILFGLFMPVGLFLWIRLVEEPELIERFSEGYREYRRGVPAFWPRARDARRYVRFLVTGT